MNINKEIKTIKIICFVLVSILFIQANPVLHNAQYTKKLTFYNHKVNKQLFSLTLNLKTSKIQVVDLHNNYIDYDKGYDDSIEIYYYDSIKKQTTKVGLTGYDTPYANSLSRLNKKTFARWDYLKIILKSPNISVKKEGFILATTSKDTPEKDRYLMYGDEFIAIKEEPPKLLGLTPIEIELDGDFNPMLGVKGISHIEGDVTENIVFWGRFDNHTLGTYDIYYSLKDKTGIQIEQAREVTVIPKKNKTQKDVDERIKTLFHYQTKKYFKDHQERDNYFLVK